MQISRFRFDAMYIFTDFMRSASTDCALSAFCTLSAVTYNSIGVMLSECVYGYAIFRSGTNSNKLLAVKTSSTRDSQASILRLTGGFVNAIYIICPCIMQVQYLLLPHIDWHWTMANTVCKNIGNGNKIVTQCQVQVELNCNKPRSTNNGLASNAWENK